jgi:hypothetical protein
MPDAHDPAALVRHAAQAGDWRLVYLIAQILSGHCSPHSTAARRAYATLVLKLGLTGDLRDYHRA